MKLKVTLAALALAALPSLSFAMCSWDKQQADTAAQCGEGQVYDSASGTCVTSATS